MNATFTSPWRLLGAVFAAALGIAFFFIIGVFSLSAAIIALALFVALAVTISRRPQTERNQP
jgi:uncharacterized membrane protein YgaE (UPF0421/DUF939 family)